MTDKKGAVQEIKEWIFLIIIGIFAVYIIRNFGFRITAVKGQSMEPGYVHGEYVFTDVLSYKISDPKRNDIVICEYDGGIESENFIKRIIGCPGDEINIFYDENVDCYKTSVNGELIDESYIKSDMASAGTMDYPVKLAGDEYFVMGDNRNVSIDSREKNVGTFHEDDIIGKVRFKLVNKVK